MTKRPFIGWWMVGAGSLCYGFGISPMYYGWGLFQPEMQPALGLSDTQSGFVFSVFSWTYHLLGPVCGIAMARWGIRWVMVPGSAVAVLGFWMLSRAESFVDCIIAYGILGGIAIGFSTILPAQTLASNWFVRYRARAIALVLGGGAIVGTWVNMLFAPGILRIADWRTGWLIIAGISAVVGVVALVFLRGTPEKVRQQPDGGAAPSDSDQDRATGPTGHGEWTAPLALRTSQFYILVGLSIAYGVPWGIIAVYGRLHLESLGFTTAAAGAILGARVFVSLFGRFSASFGDFMPPQRLLAIVLLVEGIGSAGLIVAGNPLLAYASVVLIGLGFGAAYVSIPVVFSSFYGRRAFGTTVGIRFAITGVVAPASPTLAGMLSDWSGSHVLSFSIMATVCLLGALVAFGLRAPVLGARPIAPATTSSIK